MWQALPLCMLVLIVAGSLRRDIGMTVTPAILFYDWALCTAYVMICGDTYPWIAFAIFDFLAGLSVTLVYITNWQRAIIISYGAELLCHAAFGFGLQDESAHVNGYDVLLIGAWLQVLLCVGWLIHESIRSGVHLPFSGKAVRQGGSKAP